MLTTFVTSAARSVAAFEPDDDFFARFDVEEDVFFTRLDVEDAAFLPVSARFGITETTGTEPEVSVNQDFNREKKTRLEKLKSYHRRLNRMTGKCSLLKTRPPGPSVGVCLRPD